MAIDLVGLVSQFLTPQLVGSLARAVGINEAVAQKLVSAAIPVVLGALATTAAAPGGAQKLVDAVSNSDPDLLDQARRRDQRRQRAQPQRRRQSARRPARRLGLVEPCRRLEPILRRNPTRGPVDGRRRHAGGDRLDRPAGPVQLVGSFLASPRCSALRRTRSPPPFRLKFPGPSPQPVCWTASAAFAPTAVRTASAATSRPATPASAPVSPAAAPPPPGRRSLRPRAGSRCGRSFC